MANSTNTTGTSINALIKEGKTLGSIWAKLYSVKQSTKANGFDTRLGKLLSELKAQSSLDSGQISRQVLTAHGIHNIDRRRRSEALWFVENEVEAREFMQASKKGFTSLSALQKAINASKKQDDTAEPSKEETSDVGQSDETPSKEVADKPKVTQTVMVNTILQHVEANHLSLESVIEELISHVAKRNTKVAA